MKLTPPKLKTGMLIVAAVIALTLTLSSLVVRTWQCKVYFTQAKAAGSDLDASVCNDEQFDQLQAQASLNALGGSKMKPNVNRGFPFVMTNSDELQLTTLPATLGNFIFYLFCVVLLWYILTLTGILDPKTFASLAPLAPMWYDDNILTPCGGVTHL